LQALSSATLNSAVLCLLAVDRKMLLASSFDHRLTLFDAQNGLEQIAPQLDVWNDYK
jgi:hypothetical protein